MKVTISEVDRLRSALEDEQAKNCLRAFFAEKVEYHNRMILDEVKKPNPNMHVVAQYAGVADACGRMFGEIESLIKV